MEHGIVAQVQRVIAIARRAQLHDQRFVVGLFDGHHTLLAHRFGKTRLCTGDTVLYLDTGVVGIGAGRKVTVSTNTPSLPATDFM